MLNFESLTVSIFHDWTLQVICGKKWERTPCTVSEAAFTLQRFPTQYTSGKEQRVEQLYCGRHFWREAVLTSPDIGRKHNRCLGVGSAEPMLPCCIPADGLRSAGVLSSLRSRDWNRNPVWKYTLFFFFFPILKERQKNRAARLHSERPCKQFNVLDGVHFKPCPSSTTVTTTEKILFK